MAPPGGSEAGFQTTGTLFQLGLVEGLMKTQPFKTQSTSLRFSTSFTSICLGGPAVKLTSPTVIRHSGSFFFDLLGKENILLQLLCYLEFITS